TTTTLPSTRPTAGESTSWPIAWRSCREASPARCGATLCLVLIYRRRLRGDRRLRASSTAPRAVELREICFGTGSLNMAMASFVFEAGRGNEGRGAAELAGWPAAWWPPRWVALLFAVGALVLLPWVAVLVVALPSAHRAAHWDIAWAGFDVG